MRAPDQRPWRLTMDLEQLRLRAAPLRQFLAERNFPLSHNQALDLLAAAPGLRTWPEVNAFRERVAAESLSLRAATRVAKRIASKGGPTIDETELLRLLESGAATPGVGLVVWPDGAPRGIYVTSDGDAATEAIRRYSEESGEALFFTSGLDFFEGNAIELGETGIFSAGLSRAPSGTLLAMTLAIDRDSWDDLRARLTAAWNAADGGLRVLVLCSTPTPESLHTDVSLLTHTQGEPAPGETNWLFGIVAEDGELREQLPFAPKPAKVEFPVDLPPSKLSLPASVESELAAALAARTTGIIVAGMLAEAGENRPLEVIAALLPKLLQIGPVGRIPRHNMYDGFHPVPDSVAMLPIFASVESAIAAGCAVIVFDMAFYGETQEMLECIDRALFVVGVKALGVGRGISNALSSMRNMDDAVDLVTAAICTGTVRGKASKPMTWDMYVRVENLAEDNARRKQPREFEDMFDAARVVRREDQIAQWLAEGIVSEKSVRKDFPYLRIPKNPAPSATSIRP